VSNIPPFSTRRRVLPAAPRGICAGVVRAIAAVEKALEVHGPPVHVRHEIVHDKYVVQTLDRYANNGYGILLIGHEGHEEVIGPLGEAPDHITLVDRLEEVAHVEVRDTSKVVRLSRTTLSVDETMQTVGSRNSSNSERLVDGVLQWPAESGYGDVETVTTTDESITFSLPRELSPREEDR